MIHHPVHVCITAIQRYCDFGRWHLRFDLQFGVNDLGFHLIRWQLGLRFEVYNLNLS